MVGAISEENWPASADLFPQKLEIGRVVVTPYP